MRARVCARVSVRVRSVLGFCIINDPGSVIDLCWERRLGDSALPDSQILPPAVSSSWNVSTGR